MMTGVLHRAEDDLPVGKETNDRATTTDAVTDLPDGGNVQGNDGQTILGHRIGGARTYLHRPWYFGRHRTANSCLGHGGSVHISRCNDADDGKLRSQDWNTFSGHASTWKHRTAFGVISLFRQ